MSEMIHAGGSISDELQWPLWIWWQFTQGIPKPASGTTYVQHSDKERNLWYLSADLLGGYWVQVVRAGASIFEELRWPPWTPESYRMRVRGGFSATSCKKIPRRVVVKRWWQCCGQTARQRQRPGLDRRRLSYGGGEGSSFEVAKNDVKEPGGSLHEQSINQ